MELLLITDSRLKISLTAADMASYDLSAESLDYANTGTRSAIWQILDIAKHRTGFDAADGRILLQVYPSVCGGCEMFVTKLLPAGKPSFRAFSSDSVGEILDLCGKLRAWSGITITESSLFLSDDGRYYLIVTLDGSLPTDPALEREAERALCLLSEHGELLIYRNAIARLTK